MAFSEQEIEEFRAEALELLELGERSLLSIEQGEDFRPLFDAVFRGFHNLKGAAGVMEFTQLQAHTHELETILIKFKDAGSLPKEYVRFFLRGIDAAKSLLNSEKIEFDFTEPLSQAASQPQASLDHPEISPDHEEEMAEFLSECEDLIERVFKSLKLLANAPLEISGSGHYSNHKQTIDEIYRAIHSLKGSAHLFSFHKLGEVAHAMESSLEGVRAGTYLLSRELIAGLFKGIQVVELAVNRIKSKTPDEDLSKITTSFLKMITLFSHRLEAVQVTELPNPESPALVGKETPIKAELSKAEISAKPEVSPDSATANSIRVPVSLLDHLMTLMGEMVLVRNQVLQFSSQREDLELLSMSKRLNGVTAEIQGEMMKTRLQPIGTILEKFNRVVHDLSQDLKKNIRLDISGAETEVDRTLLEAMRDPLVHIIRNACDHGIESPGDRQKAGKTDYGTIHIETYHEGGHVIIQVQDDGKGLSREAILKKAAEKGLVSQTESDELSDKEIFNFVFIPGFSTAEQVTSISGRGVGMDVVKTNIEKIDGTVDLSSVPGKGTLIRIKIPLTLAIIPALMVKCSQETFAIPQTKLEELVRADQSSSEAKIENLHGSWVFRLRGNLLPLVDLNQVLGMKSGVTTETPNQTSLGTLNIAVVNAEHTSFGLIVDEVHDTADIVVKPLNRLLKNLQVYSGATLLGDGSIALILDIPGIAKFVQLRGNEKSKDQKPQKSFSSEFQDYLLVRLGSATHHAIVLNYVKRLEEFSRNQIEYSGAIPVIRYGESILPIISANRLMGYPRADDPSGKISVVVVHRADSLYGIEVDAILDTLSSSAALDLGARKQAGIVGSLNLEDKIVVVIDPFELIDLGFSESITDQTSAAGADRSQSLERILVVEDTVFFRRALRNVLEKTGYAVVTANDGQEGIEVLNSSKVHFDLIISDIEMPRMNGFQFADAVRKHPKFSNVPLLAVSSRADAASMTEGKQSGFNRYLEKFKPAALLEAVSQLIAEKRSVG